MLNKQLAKQAAAFKACVMLHQNGELSDNLLPFNNVRKMENVKDLYFKHWENYKESMFLASSIFKWLLIVCFHRIAEAGGH